MKIKKGVYTIIYNDTPQFSTVIEKALSNDKLVIINKKNDFYDTNKEKEHVFPHKLACILEEGPKRKNRDPKIYVKSIYIDLIDRMKSNKSATSKAAVNYIVGLHDLAALLNAYKAFGLFYEFAEKCTTSGGSAKYLVRSIEAVKGLDSNVVFFILNDSFYYYFDMDNVSKDRRYNKEWKKLYVALTRSKDKLIFILDKRMLSQEILEKYEEYFARKNVSVIENGNKCLEWL